MIDYICNKTTEYINKMDKNERKKYGQFFTSKETAQFMASLFSIPENKDTLKILDAGAGTGILSAALIDRLQEYPIKSIRLCCYENDNNILPLLRANLKKLNENSKISISFSINTENYILSQQSEFEELIDSTNNVKYDLIISNPPYKKISKNAPEARALQLLCYGAPNLYFLFASMSLFNLKENCEMVYIIPRSWTSGAYFKKFRNYFLSAGILEHIHLFASRNKVFEQESVLQETIIIKVRKTSIKPDFVMITTTNSNKDFSKIISFKAPYSTVVTGSSSYVYLVTNECDIDILNQINQWNNTLPDLGLKMKTGLTVDFRNRDSLRDIEEKNAVPLFYSQHIKNGKVLFPIGKGNEYLVTEQKGLLQNNENYLLVKRFTSKEEYKRLQCGIYLSKMYSSYNKISTQNKVNFISGINELSECSVYGLYVLFNSTLYDSYYRILNGSTQVNSTEINSMPVPPLNLIESMGKELIDKSDLSEKVCNTILRNHI